MVKIDFLIIKYTILYSNEKTIMDELIYLVQNISHLKNLTHDPHKIIISSDYPEPINYFPNSITHLRFSSHYKHHISNLPSTITHLDLNLAIIDLIPSSVTHLILCSKNLIKNNIPDNVQFLRIVFHNNSTKEDSMIENIPPTIKQITIYGAKNKKFIKKIPFGCELIIKEQILSFPLYNFLW